MPPLRFDDYPRAFAFAFGAQDAAALAALVAPAGSLHSLTGLWAEGRAAAEAAFAAECRGIFARARLVTGKGSVLPLGPGLALLRQRFVITGALTGTGEELPRFGAMLVAVLQAENETCEALSLTFTALA